MDIDEGVSASVADEGGQGAFVECRSPITIIVAS